MEAELKPMQGGPVVRLTCEGDTGASPWRLIHLSVHKRALRLAGLVTGLDDAGLDHLTVQVVALHNASIENVAGPALSATPNAPTKPCHHVASRFAHPSLV